MNNPIIIAIALATIWAIASFFGFIGTVPKAFNKQQSSSISGQTISKQQRENAATTEEKRRQMMDDMKQRISDARGH